MYFAIPIFATINVRDKNEAEQARNVIQQLLQNEMVRMTLASNGVHVLASQTGEPYACEAPQQQQQPQAYAPNGRR